MKKITLLLFSFVFFQLSFAQQIGANFNENIENPDPSQEYLLTQIPVNDQWSYTLGAVYKNFFDKGFHTFVLSRNMLNNSFYKYPDNDESMDKSFDYQSIEAENKFRYELTLRDKGFKYNFSSNLEYAHYENGTTQSIFINDSLINFNYFSSLNFFKYGVSANVSKRILNSRLLVSVGIRFDGMDYNSDMSNLLNQSSPRIALSYTLSEKFLLNGAIGKYYQLPAYTTLGFRNETEELVNAESAKYLGVNQYNLGLEYRLSEMVVFSLEGFMKDYYNYPIDVYSGASLANQGADYSSIAGATNATFTGTGEANGIEFKKHPTYLPLVQAKAEELGVDVTPSLEVLSVEPPAERKAGIKVESVEELVDKLRNEAKVIS